MTVRERVVQVLVDELDLDQEKMVDEATLEDVLGTDSLDAVEAAIVLEREFDIDISADEAEKVRTVGDLVALVTGKVA